MIGSDTRSFREGGREILVLCQFVVWPERASELALGGRMARWGLAYLDGWIRPWVLPLFLGGWNMGVDIWGVRKVHGEFFLWGQDYGVLSVKGGK